ncbi:hypothetical protein BKA67DRAFT_244950 [Truncatella angustata]|uniref:Uncharacterized protein n=1 Tax=Truncatella angustata TaxID=152316 RepID=A0A9P8UNQ9_9PEZI|nr:uncharacterized protein BKA67DRAFT_244950 [Truncatella angustata]KAH6655651.1 hypothetical protein BKA67DRAFT_244950 [Truncatella angustata]
MMIVLCHRGWREAFSSQIAIFATSLTAPPCALGLPVPTMAWMSYVMRELRTRSGSRNRILNRSAPGCLASRPPLPDRQDFRAQGFCQKPHVDVSEA